MCIISHDQSIVNLLKKCCCIRKSDLNLFNYYLSFKHKMHKANFRNNHIY